MKKIKCLVFFVALMCFFAPAKGAWAKWCYVDVDLDGYGDPADKILSLSCTGGRIAVGGDCDDSSVSIHPGATEVCNSIDDDCDTVVDEGVTTTYYPDEDGDEYGVAGGMDYVEACTAPDGYADNNADCNDANAEINPRTAWYRDADGDGYGYTFSSVSSCTQPTGYVLTPNDCDDDEAKAHPDGVEVCDGIDNDCSGTVDDSPSDGTIYHHDLDGDGYGGLGTVTACSMPTGFVENSEDCNDSSASVYPGATEICNSTDDDCDGAIDEMGATGGMTYYHDSDGDGYGNTSDTMSLCGPTMGYITRAGDCDDSRTTVNPGTPEACGDSIDNNCNGSIDEDGATGSTHYYRDSDGDGHGNPSDSRFSCSVPAGYSAFNDDCDDAHANIYPGAAEICDSIDNDCDDSVDEGVQTTYYLDGDGDGYGLSSTTVTACTPPSIAYATSGGDCDDRLANVHPGVTETCDSIDNDCDGSIDETGATGETTWYYDGDHDGYGSVGRSVLACSAPTDYVADHTDCNDRLVTAYPGATESCNSIDDDCDGEIDEGISITLYQDIDSDGYGNPLASTISCSVRYGFVENNTDCDDTSANTHPGAVEVCDGLDNDCNTTVDEGVTTAYYRDADGDTYGDSSSTISACIAPTGYVSNNTDCNDTRSSDYPGAIETCDTRDNDCDGAIDDADADVTGQLIWYLDADADGYGVDGSTMSACAKPEGYASVSGDCNDADTNYHPGATETDCTDPNDYNCDGSVGYTDTDSDGFAACEECNDSNDAIYPGADEWCSTVGVDDDCDGVIDESDAVDALAWYQDADIDGFGNLSVLALSCLSIPSYVSNSTDCNDTSAESYPGATEIVDGLDNDCDEAVDEDTLNFYQDLDGDGYGNPAVVQEAYSQPTGYVADNTDCDDTNADRFPTNTEVCEDGIDQDCREGDLTCPASTVDVDVDGFADDVDCDDNNPDVNPAAAEICEDGIDQNCDGVDVDCDSSDADSDGYEVGVDCDDNNATVHPNATEVCGDGVDQDCSGSDLSCPSAPVEPTSSAVCGNDVLESSEACDDGNTDDGDGCDSTCQIEESESGSDSAGSGGGSCSLAKVSSLESQVSSQGMAIFMMVGLAGLVVLRRQKRVV